MKEVPLTTKSISQPNFVLNNKKGFNTNKPEQWR